MPYWDEDDENDGGLPDAAFTELELAAGVQHIVRTGDPDATSSGCGRYGREHGYVEDESGRENAAAGQDGADDPELSHFTTFEDARIWAQQSPSRVFSRSPNGSGFDAKPNAPVLAAHPAGPNLVAPAPRPAVPGLLPYPIDNPATATWVPGSYPANEDEDDLFDIDYHNKRIVFWPALKRLSPSIYQKAKRQHNAIGLCNVMSSPFHQKQSRHDLFQLLTLLEDQLERSTTWYARQKELRDAHYARVERGELPDCRTQWRKDQDAKNRGKAKVPGEVLFWREAVEIVMGELIDRE
jgi:hypothetical protein